MERTIFSDTADFFSDEVQLPLYAPTADFVIQNYGFFSHFNFLSPHSLVFFIVGAFYVGFFL